MSYRDPLLTTTSTLPSPLIWALVASTVVHSAFAVLPHAAPSRGSGTIADRADVLRVALVRPNAQSSDAPADAPVELVAAAASTMLNRAVQDPVLPPEQVTAPANSTRPAPAQVAVEQVAIGGLGEMQVDGQLLEDRSRLGDLMSRQLSEFPVEVDFPVRLMETIRARYPPSALAAGREDSVAVWVVVDGEGAVEEVQVVDGAEEFADVVAAAVKEVRFQPARNNLMPIRFPIALEFQFSLGATAVTASTAAAR